MHSTFGLGPKRYRWPPYLGGMGGALWPYVMSYVSWPTDNRARGDKHRAAGTLGLRLVTHNRITSHFVYVRTSQPGH